MISYKTIHQTDKMSEHQQATEDWLTMNEIDGWRLNFLDDEAAWKWVEEEFWDSDVLWAWQYMHRGVLRADFLRYLLLLVEGGVYSDVDVSTHKFACTFLTRADCTTTTDRAMGNAQRRVSRHFQHRRGRLGRDPVDLSVRSRGRGCRRT